MFLEGHRFLSTLLFKVMVTCTDYTYAVYCTWYISNWPKRHRFVKCVPDGNAEEGLRSRIYWKVVVAFQRSWN